MIKEFEVGEIVYVEARYHKRKVSIYPHLVQTKNTRGEYFYTDAYTDELIFSIKEMREKLKVESVESFPEVFYMPEYGFVEDAVSDLREGHSVKVTYTGEACARVLLSIPKQKTKLEALSEILGKQATQEQLDKVLGGCDGN